MRSAVEAPAAGRLRFDGLSPRGDCWTPTSTSTDRTPEPSPSVNLIEARPGVIGTRECLVVDARELHAFLLVGKDFSEWIKAQLDGLFAQDVVFKVFPQKGELGGKPKIEYMLTIECAKHIALMSRTQVGRVVRDYFIECERDRRRSKNIHISGVFRNRKKLKRSDSPVTYHSSFWNTGEQHA